MNDSQAAQVALQLRSTAAGVQHQMTRAVMWLRPDGWQGRARRNAWGAMIADHQHRHGRTADRDSVRGSVTAVRAISASAR